MLFVKALVTLQVVTTFWSDERCCSGCPAAAEGGSHFRELPSLPRPSQTTRLFAATAPRGGDLHGAHRRVADELEQAHRFDVDDLLGAGPAPTLHVTADIAPRPLAAAHYDSGSATLGMP